MKKFIVSYRIDNAEQYRGEEPHSDVADTLDDYTEAEDKEEAISYAIDYLAEQASANGDCSVEIDEDKEEIIIFDGAGKVVECYYYFTAKEVE